MQLHDHRIAAVVNQRVNFAKWDRVDRAPVMTQFERTDRDFLD
jgi:hypothetical protein